MRVLHVTPSFYPAIYYGGPVHSLYGLCNALFDEGADIRVLTTDTAGPGERLEVAGIPTPSVKGYPVYYYPRRYRTSVSPDLLPHLFEMVQWSDVVHLTAVYSFPTLPTLLACRILKKPLVWSPRGSLQRWPGAARLRQKAFWEFLCRRVGPHRLAFHLTSEEEREESLKKFPGVQSSVIPNGVEIPEDAPRPSSNGMLRLLYLGRLHPKKGIENLFEALAEIQTRKLLTWSLKLAGAGNSDYTKALKSRISKLGLSDRIEMLGEVNGQEKEALFRKTDILVAPSYTENFGMVIAEALAHGVPVIAGRGTPWRRIEEVECGRWTDNDPASLAKAIEEISREPLHEMGERGRRWMKEEFSWKDQARHMSQLYLSLMKS